jgi:hypothetical protein
MVLASTYLGRLEECPDLGKPVILSTKINNVLKNIFEHEDFPLDANFQIKNRSKRLYEKWQKIVEREEQSTKESPDTNRQHQSQARDLVSDKKADRDMARPGIEVNPYDYRYLL